MSDRRHTSSSSSSSFSSPRYRCRDRSRSPRRDRSDCYSDNSWSSNSRSNFERVPNKHRYQCLYMILGICHEKDCRWNHSQDLPLTKYSIPIAREFQRLQDENKELQKQLHNHEQEIHTLREQVARNSSMNGLTHKYWNVLNAISSLNQATTAQLNSVGLCPQPQPQPQPQTYPSTSPQQPPQA